MVLQGKGSGLPVRYSWEKDKCDMGGEFSLAMQLCSCQSRRQREDLHRYAANLQVFVSLPTLSTANKVPGAEQSPG